MISSWIRRRNWSGRRLGDRCCSFHYRLCRRSLSELTLFSPVRKFGLIAITCDDLLVDLQVRSAPNAFLADFSLTQNVLISPLPLTSIFPRGEMLISGYCASRSPAARAEQWMRFSFELLSIRLAVFTVSPNRQYLGLRDPTTLATTAPE